MAEGDVQIVFKCTEDGCGDIFESQVEAFQHQIDLGTEDTFHGKWELIPANQLTGQEKANLAAANSKVESFIFTFGPDHTDKDGNSLGGCYVEIPGDSETSRDQMIELFGRNWAFQYGSVEAATRNGKYQLTNRSADLVPWEVWT